MGLLGLIARNAQNGSGPDDDLIRTDGLVKLLHSDNRIRRRIVGLDDVPITDDKLIEILDNDARIRRMKKQRRITDDALLRILKYDEKNAQRITKWDLLKILTNSDRIRWIGHDAWIRQLSNEDLLRILEGNTPVCDADRIDDMTFIRCIEHHFNLGWNEYMVVLAAQGYGWDFMVSWAADIAAADFEKIEHVSIAENAAGPRKDITSEYINDPVICRMPSLAQEQGVLLIGGFSRKMKAPIMIVWYNQTQVLKISSPASMDLLEADHLIERYAETVIRRSFGTENEMKLAKPLPSEA